MKKIDDSALFKCPTNPQHKLRKSTSPHYCELWCDNCKSGWMKKELVKSGQDANKEIIWALSKDTNFFAYRIVLDKSTLSTLKKYKQIAMQEDMRFAKIQAAVALSYSPMGFGDIHFEQDPGESKRMDFMYLMRQRVISKESQILTTPSENLSKTERVASTNYLFEISHLGFRLIPNTTSCFTVSANTELIPWEMIK